MNHLDKKKQVRRTAGRAAKVVAIVAIAWVAWTPGGDVQAAHHTIAHYNSK